MHIAYITQGIYPHVVGGMEIFNFFLIQEMAKSNQISLYTTKKVDFGSKVRVEVIDPRLFGISCFRMGQLWLSIKILIKLSNAKQKPDVIHVPFTSNSRYLGLVFPFVTKLLGIPYLVSVHSGDLREWKPQWMFLRLFKHAKQIVAVSEVLKVEYEKRTGKPVRVILPLIPFQKTGLTKSELRQKHDIDDDRFVILFQGTLKELKHPMDVLASLKYMGLEYLKQNKVLVLFVGGGAQRQQMLDFVSSNNLGDHVRLVGRVPYEDTAIYYEVADLYVIASDYEGTSKSMVGALFHGLPLIGSNVEGINNIVSDGVNGLLFPVLDTAKLAGLVQTMIEDTELRLRLAKESVATYNANYSFEQTVVEFFDAYSSITLIKK